MLGSRNNMCSTNSPQYMLNGQMSFLNISGISARHSDDYIHDRCQKATISCEWQSCAHPSCRHSLTARIMLSEFPLVLMAISRSPTRPLSVAQRFLRNHNHSRMRSKKIYRSSMLEPATHDGFEKRLTNFRGHVVAVGCAARRCRREASCC